MINFVRFEEPTVVIGSNQNGMQWVIPFICGNTLPKHCRRTDCIFPTRVVIMELGKPIFSPE
ncbi:hypothetical protein [Ursidibacter maritimus]|uniref:hypothetical protein n=1 Tax=Ursidibacter maritimus TaxID=1331689 RepID=UPI001C465877|nr:hypothetical protein [Ursidibacter maritimus]MBV6541673.1 hypothetical protein [Ursidibacter maritimus]